MLMEKQDLEGILLSIMMLIKKNECIYISTTGFPLKIDIFPKLLYPNKKICIKSVPPPPPQIGIFNIHSFFIRTMVLNQIPSKTPNRNKNHWTSRKKILPPFF